MKRLIGLLILMVVTTLSSYAKEFAWVCAIEWSEKRPEWVFVSEDIKLQSDGTYRIFVKWEFDNSDPKQSKAMQTWLLSPDFDQTYVVSSTGYNSKGEVVYSEKSPYGGWSYILPETNASAIVETVKEILLKE